MPNIRRPGVEVIQEFQQIAVALGLPALPTMIIGPGYQVMTKETVGNYSGSSMSYPYANLVSTGIVDLAEASEDPYDVSYPVRVFIENGIMIFIATRTTGIATEASKSFEDVSSVAFQTVNVGDKLVIESGDNMGSYTIVSKDPTTYAKVNLNVEMASSASGVSYHIERAFESIEIPRDTVGLTIDENSVDLPDALQNNGHDIIDGDVKLNYRALRPEFYNNVRVFSQFSDIEAAFGIGQVVPENPLAFGVAISLQNTTTSIGGLGLDATVITDVTQAHQKALDKAKSIKIGGEDVYCLVPLTQEPVVHQLYDVHVEQMSMPEKKRERVAIINRKIKSTTTIAEESTTSGLYNVTEARIDVGTIVLSPSPLVTHFKDLVTTNAFANVQVGDLLVITEVGANAGSHTITQKVSNSEIVVSTVFTLAQNDVDYQIKRNDGLWRDGKTFYDSNANFIADGVEAGHYLEVRDSVGSITWTGRFLISAVNTNNKLTLGEAQGGAPFSDVRYEVNRDFTLDEECSYIAGYAASFANRRLVMVWPDVAEIPTAGTVKYLPGFYFGCAIGGMVSGLPAHQGFTNLTLSGFIGFLNSGDRYSEDQLDVIANGGVMILNQDVAEAPLYVRHQLTTDTSAIAYQEFSITRNVDSISKLIRSTYRPFIGVYNINDPLIDLLKTVGNGLISFLKKSKLAKIGAPLRNGSILSMVESTEFPDTIESEWDISVPYPFNNLKLKLLI